MNKNSTTQSLFIRNLTFELFPEPDDIRDHSYPSADWLLPLC